MSSYLNRAQAALDKAKNGVEQAKAFYSKNKGTIDDLKNQVSSIRGKGESVHAMNLRPRHHHTESNKKKHKKTASKKNAKKW
jgi:hypothetical protein